MKAPNFTVFVLLAFGVAHIISSEHPTPAVVSGGLWIIGKKCPLGHLETFFEGALGYNEETAMAECAEECDANDDCKFADLYWSSSMQACYLRSDKCGNYETNESPDYRLYIKGGYGSCPGSHPYAYYNGQCCCASGFEKNYPPQGAKCDRSRIQIDSLCCRDDIHTRCPFGKCSNAATLTPRTTTPTSPESTSATKMTETNSFNETSIAGQTSINKLTSMSTGGKDIETTKPRILTTRPTTRTKPTEFKKPTTSIKPNQDDAGPGADTWVFGFAVKKQVDDYVMMLSIVSFFLFMI